MGFTFKLFQCSICYFVFIHIQISKDFIMQFRIKTGHLNCMLNRNFLYLNFILNQTELILNKIIFALISISHNLKIHSKFSLQFKNYSDTLNSFFNLYF